MAPSARRAAEWLPLVLIAAGWGGLVSALVVLGPAVQVPGALAYLVAFAAVAASALTAGVVAPAGSPLGTAAVVTAAVAGLAAAAALGARQGDPAAAALVTTALLAGGAALGSAVGGRVEHPGHLLVVAVVSLLVDSFSVLHSAGPVAAAVGRPEVIALAALPWPIVGTPHVAPVLGVGDVIFSALYLAAARRHGLSLVRTLAALAVGLLVTAVAVLVTRMPVPALPAMGAAVLVAHPAARKLPEKDRRKGWIAIGVLAALWLASWTLR